jgi:hypothetical protein
MVPPGSILLFSSTTLSPEPLCVITHHAVPVTAMAYHLPMRWVVSGNASSVLKVWDIPLSSPWGGGGGGAALDSRRRRGALPYASKLDTDLYALMKKRAYAIDMAVARMAAAGSQTPKHGGRFAVYSLNRKVLLFALGGCKLVCIYDKRMHVYNGILLSGSSAFGMDVIEYGKRAALKHKMDDAHLLAGGCRTTRRQGRTSRQSPPPPSGGVGLPPAPEHDV